MYLFFSPHHNYDCYKIPTIQFITNKSVNFKQSLLRFKISSDLLYLLAPIRTMETQPNPFNSLHSQISILSHKLKMLRDQQLPLNPPPSTQTLIPTIKEIFQANPQTLQTTILPPFLSWLEGRTSSQEQLEQQLVAQVGGNVKFWKKIISKHAELKEQEGTPRIWEVKKKYLELMKQFLDIEKVSWLREVKGKRRKMLDMFSKHIKDIGQNLLGEEELNEQHVKLLRGEIDFYKFLKGNGSKPVKGRKKEQRPTTQNQNNQEKQKENQDKIQVENQELMRTPMKKEMEVEMPASEVKEEDSQGSGSELKKEEKENTNFNQNAKVQTKEKNRRKREPKQPKEPKMPKEPKQPKQPKEPKVKESPITSPLPVNPLFLKYFKPKTAQVKNQQVVVVIKQEEEEIKLQEEKPHSYMLLNLLNDPISKEQAQKQFQQTSDQTPQRSYLNLYIYDNYYYIENQLLPDHPIDPLHPFHQHDKINYEDSEQQYKDYKQYLVQQNISQQQERSQDDEDSGQGTIVPDSYVSFEDGVSESSDEQEKFDAEACFGEKYQYSWKLNEEEMPNTGIFILEGLKCPIPIRPPAPQPISSEQKACILKMIHGCYDNTRKLVLDIHQKVPSLSKLSIRRMIEEYSTKQLSKRILKPSVVQDFSQLIESFGINLEQILKQREEEVKRQRQIRRAENRMRRQELRKEKELENQTQLQFAGVMEVEEPPQQAISQQ